MSLRGGGKELHDTVSLMEGKRRSEVGRETRREEGGMEREYIGER